MFRYLILPLLISTTLTATATKYTPQPNKDATTAQLQLYNQFTPYLPLLSSDTYPEGSIFVYVYPGLQDRKCTDNPTPLYWTWFSNVTNIPILSGYASDSCQEKDVCTNETRFSGKFQKCAISGLSHDAYTSSGFDRGHMVSSHSLARSYGASCETFNMCNIAPQSAQMNREDWRNLESAEQAFLEQNDILVMQGALLSKASENAQCLCGGEPNGMIQCSNVFSKKCNAKNWQIRIPYGFFKVIVSLEQKKSWAFSFTKAQSDKPSEPQPECTGPCESIDDAFASQPSEIDALLVNANFDWTYLKTTANTECKWCNKSSQLQTISIASAAPPPPLPSWGGSASFTVRVNLTAHDVIKSGASWWFNYSYLSNTDTNTTFSRYDHEEGQRDEVCNGIKKDTTQKCTTIHATDGWMYMLFPDSAYCCKCTNKIGPVRTDWLQDGGANYVGRTNVDDVAVDEWLKKGASDNHYYATPDVQQAPVRYMEHKNGLLKQWDFKMDTFVNESVARSIFSPPENCQRRCIAAICFL